MSVVTSASNERGLQWANTGWSSTQCIDGGNGFYYYGTAVFWKGVLERLMYVTSFECRRSESKMHFL